MEANNHLHSHTHQVNLECMFLDRGRKSENLSENPSRHRENLQTPNRNVSWPGMELTTFCEVTVLIMSPLFHHVFIYLFFCTVIHSFAALPGSWLILICWIILPLPPLDSFPSRSIAGNSAELNTHTHTHTQCAQANQWGITEGISLVSGTSWSAERQSRIPLTLSHARGTVMSSVTVAPQQPLLPPPPHSKRRHPPTTIRTATGTICLAP